MTGKEHEHPLAGVAPETVALHADRLRPEAVNRPLVAPIHPSVVWTFDDLATVDEVWEGRRPGFIYARMGHPNRTVLERAVARLHGAPAAVATASGMAALASAILAACSAGDHLVASSRLYGGTHSLLEGHLRRLGLAVDYADQTDARAVQAALRPNTRLVLVETLSNPTLSLPDLEGLAGLARQRGFSLLVDNTFCSPVLHRPLEWGATAVVESVTKYLAGHSDVTGGVLAGPAELVQRAALVARDLGGSLDPVSAWLAVRGMKTVFLRLERHSENGMAVARWLAGRRGVLRVYYPGLAEHPQHGLARRLLPRGFGGMVSFEVAGGRAGAEVFTGHLRLIANAPSLADVTTTLLHPATTSHRYLAPERRAAAGVTDGLIRLSVGLEPVADLVADLERGLSAVVRSGLG